MDTDLPSILMYMNAINSLANNSHAWTFACAHLDDYLITLRKIYALPTNKATLVIGSWDDPEVTELELGIQGRLKATIYVRECVKGRIPGFIETGMGRGKILLHESVSEKKYDELFKKTDFNEPPLTLALFGHGATSFLVRRTEIKPPDQQWFVNFNDPNKGSWFRKCESLTDD